MDNIKEIGSEFWLVETNKTDQAFFVSGRTALDFIIRDILKEKKITRAYIPSLCCHSMIEPFLKNSIQVSFYDVYFKDGLLMADIPSVCDGEIFFYIKYFGYTSQNTGIPADIKKSGCIVIEDATHSWLTDECTDADYIFSSYRKWTGFTGIASAKKIGGKFNILQKNVFHDKYEQLRKLSQTKKEKYLLSGEGEKEAFLKSFSEAEELLEVDYTDYLPSAQSFAKLISLDKEHIKISRRKNAQILINGISNIPGITPIFTSLAEKDAPLCVPVYVIPNLRNKLRQHLISHKIYCPVHWPLSDMHVGISEKAKDIYASQLSLVCDQRYDEDDMKRMIKCIKDFFENKNIV